MYCILISVEKLATFTYASCNIHSVPVTTSEIVAPFQKFAGELSCSKLTAQKLTLVQS